MMKKPSKSWDSMGKAELLRAVQANQFAVRDLMLYLDTHPTDANALSALMLRRQDYADAADAYAKRFGALTVMHVKDEDGWVAWSNTPWPWEKEAN